MFDLQVVQVYLDNRSIQALACTCLELNRDLKILASRVLADPIQQWLKIRSPPLVYYEAIPFEIKEIMMVGRTKECGIRLWHRQISAKHLLLKPFGTLIHCQVLGRNPTFLNGSRVQGVVLLEQGDRLVLPGRHILKLRRNNV